MKIFGQNFQIATKRTFRYGTKLLGIFWAKKASFNLEISRERA